ncbi:MAG: ribonuclease HI [Robiginitomaculum sp.]
MISGETVLTIYTDGACSGNPGPGGWGALLIYGAREKKLYGGERDTTNNRMEMMAAIRALSSLKPGYDKPIIIWTDSKYLKDGITSWIKGWKKRGWKNAKKEPVKNKDLWLSLDSLVQGKNIEWKWVKGHAGIEGNERADELARRSIPEKS